MGAGKHARGGESNIFVVNDHLNVSRERVKGGRADDGVGVGFVDCHIWPGAEKTTGAYFYRVEDSGFVGPEDLDIPMRHARMVDVEEVSGRE